MEVRETIEEQIRFLKQIQKEAPASEACAIAMTIVTLAEKLDHLPYSKKS
jgi:hypothetical protein